MPKRTELSEIQLDLSQPQLRKLAQKKTVEIKHHQLMTGSGFKVSPGKASKLATSHRKGKGMRLTLSDNEIHGNGLGQFLKNAGRFYRKQVVPVIKGPVRKGLTDAINAAAPVVGEAIGGPAGAVIGSTVANQLGSRVVNYIGDRTGAFGFHKGFAPAGTHALDKMNFVRQPPPGMARGPDLSGGSFLLDASGK